MSGEDLIYTPPLGPGDKNAPENQPRPPRNRQERRAAIAQAKATAKFRRCVKERLHTKALRIKRRRSR